MRVVAAMALLLLLALPTPPAAAPPAPLKTHLMVISGSLTPGVNQTWALAFDGEPLQKGWVFLLEARVSGSVTAVLALSGVPAKTWEVKGDGLRADPLTDGVRSLNFFRPSPIAVQGKATILAAAEPYPGQGFAAVARAGNSEVAIVGQSLWWSWITPDRSKGADNARLLQNLLTRPRKANG